MKMLSEITDFAVQHWNPIFTVAAFALSFCDLLLHLRTHRRESEKIRVRQIHENDVKSYCFPAMRDGKEITCTLVGVQIENLSRTSLSITDIQLVAPDKTRSFASRLSDTDERSGTLVLYELCGGSRHQLSLNVDADNLALHPRLDGNDSRQGYLVFFGLPAVSTGSVRHSLRLSVSGKVYKARVNIEALPSNLIPIHKAPVVPRRQS